MVVGNSLADRRGHPHRASILANLDHILELDTEHVEARFLRFCMLEEEELVDAEQLAADEARLGELMGKERFDAMRKVVALQRARQTKAAVEQLAALDPDGPADAVAVRWQLLAGLDSQREVDVPALVAREKKRGVTALTSWVRGMAMLLKGRHADARDALERSNDLCPDHPSTLHALAMTHRKLESAKLAEQCMARALGLLVQPHVNYLDEYVLCLRDQHRFDQAEQVIHRFSDSDRDRRALSLSALRTWQALHPAQQNRRSELLDDAVQLLGELLGRADLKARYRRLAERNLRIVRALREGTVEERLDVYLELAAVDPLNRSVLRKLRDDLGEVAPGDLNQTTLELLGRFLTKQIEQVNRLEQAGTLGR